MTDGPFYQHVNSFGTPPLVSTTIHISGLDHAACILATPGSAHPLARMHAGLLLTCWLGFRQVGFELWVLTHWVTTTSFMRSLSMPRFRAYLGATAALFGAEWVMGRQSPAEPHQQL